MATSEDTPPRKRVRDPQRPERILQAATTLFDEKGFHRVTMEDIGETIGASASAIYRHFSSKEEILAVIFEESIDRYMLATPPVQADAFAELDGLVTGNLTLTLSQRELATIWMREDRVLSEQYMRRLKRRERLYVARWIDCLMRCFPHRDREDCAAAALTAIEAIVALAARRPRIGPREADITRRMVLEGLHALAAPDGH